MIRHHTISLSHAFSGLMHGLKTQPNFIVHLVLSTLAVLAGLLFRLSVVEWAVLALTIFSGLVIELINTAIEATIDLVTDLYHHQAKVAKDTAAAAMLVYSFGSTIVALIIFLPKILFLLGIWPSI